MGGITVRRRDDRRLARREEQKSGSGEFCPRLQVKRSPPTSSLKASHPVSHIYAPEYLPDAAVLVGSAGQVSVADKELRVQHTFTPQNQQASTLLKHFLFPSSTCSFLSPHVAASHRAVLSLFLKSGDISRVAIVGVSEDGSLSSLGESALPMEETVRASLCSPASPLNRPPGHHRRLM